MKLNNFLKTSLFVAMAALVLPSCGDDNKTQWWDWGNGNEEPKPDPDPTPDPDPQPGEDTSKPRFIWIDAAANFSEFANSQDNIRRDLEKARNAGFTDIVVDVRPSEGDVLFKSSVAQEVKKLDWWSPTGYKFYERTADWDYLQAFIDIGHELGLRVNAAMNTMAGGCRYLYGLGEQGMLFREPDKKSWATTLWLDGKLVNAMDCDDDAYATKFFNPANDDVQNYLLTIIGDLAKYDLDGIFLDRCRYDGMASDFSDISKQKFEQYLGTTVSDFPACTESTYFKQWLAFRAQVIHDFIVKARKAVKDRNPDLRFGVYVGAWYSTYYEYGVNWASPNYNAAADFSRWASEEWNRAGYADQLDYLLLGAYAGANSIYGTTEWTCQGFCQKAQKYLAGAVQFAGGPDVGNGTGFENGGQGNAVRQSVDACINASDGYFLFDMVHVRQYGYWNYLKMGIDDYLKTLK